MAIIDPSFNYDKYGQQYSGQRRTDPRIAVYINKALGDSKTVLNIGAGAGSYEPEDRYLVAVEPSAVMRAQRMHNYKVPAVIASAASLPFDDHAFDASMALITVHHWPDIQKGVAELRRVTRQQIVIMTLDPDALEDFWNAQYFPEIIDIEKQRFPKIDFLLTALNGTCEVHSIPIPLDCADGFQEAFYGRPEAFLDKEVRKAQSAWGFLPEGEEDKIVDRLRKDLASGAWDKQFGHFRTTPSFTGALRLIVAYP
jgi:SAM-dependent methyltransferase